MSVFSLVKALLGTRIRLFEAGLAYDDLTISSTNANYGPKERNPVYSQFRDNGAGSRGVYLPTFKDAQEYPEELHFTAQTSHARKNDSDLYFHIHFTTDDALDLTDNGKSVVFFVERTQATIGGVFPLTTYVESVFTWDIPGNPAHVQYGHILHDLETVHGAGLGISSIFVMRIGRDSTHVLDTSSRRIMALAWDWHVIIDGFGSEEEGVKVV